MFELVATDPVADLIDRRAAELQRELDAIVDAALVAIGVPQSTVNRRRGQLRRYAKESQ